MLLMASFSCKIKSSSVWRINGLNVFDTSLISLKWFFTLNLQKIIAKMHWNVKHVLHWHATCVRELMISFHNMLRQLIEMKSLKIVSMLVVSKFLSPFFRIFLCVNKDDFENHLDTCTPNISISSDLFIFRLFAISLFHQLTKTFFISREVSWRECLFRLSLHQKI